MEETTPEKTERQWRGVNPTEPTQHLIDRLTELPEAELLKLLRVIVPQAIEGLPEAERAEFLSEIGQRQ